MLKYKRFLTRSLIMFKDIASLIHNKSVFFLMMCCFMLVFFQWEIVLKAQLTMIFHEFGSLALNFKARKPLILQKVTNTYS